MELTENQERIRKVANDLAEAFLWGNTPQGTEYWIGVHDNLLDLSAPSPRKPREAIIDGIKYVEVIDDE